MKRPIRLLSAIPAVTATALLTGCIVSDPIYVDCAIETDLTGEIVVEVTGIHSNDDDPVKQAEELEQYCTKGYVEQGESMASLFALDDARITLTNRTDTSCELVVEGNFDNLARALSVMAGEKDYEIRRSGPIFVARLLTGMTPDEDDGFTLVVHYVGEILAHNAHDFDEASGTMTWLGSEIDESGIQFILRSEE